MRKVSFGTDSGGLISKGGVNSTENLRPGFTVYLLLLH